MHKLAQQIFDRFDKQIVEATTGTVIQPAFIAGLVGNEVGKDRKGNIVRSVTRFEPHVFRALKSIKVNGYRISNGKRVNHYNRITQADIHDANDAALEALATSYEATQIMGWHVIKNLHCTIADLRNPDKHFFYTIKLLQLNGYVRSLSEAEMDNEMRQWNSGSENGRTYHKNYVPTAQMIRQAYRQIEKTRIHRSVAERFDVPIKTIQSGYMPSEFETFGNLEESEINFTIPQTAELRQEPQSELPTMPTESDASRTPVEPQAEAPQNSQPETVTVDAPAPTGFLSKLKAQALALFALVGGTAGAKEILGVQVSAETVELVKTIVPWAMGMGFGGFIIWYLTEKVIGWKTMSMKANFATDPNRPSLEIKPQ